jgi:FkbM family methyltransferase
MSSTATLVMVDGVRVVVPDSLDLITPYVLREQQDWFEDEIKFLRRLLQPGQRVIDIGANYGVYALSMALKVGPAGGVWAFEPAPATADLLAQAITANRFDHVVLERKAVSDACGSGRLSLNEHSELNALLRTEGRVGAVANVPLVTLDESMRNHGWQDIDFVKIDAEGEEAAILKGGGRFFSRLSPLVQYEVKAGEELHLELVREFSALGYASYRLVPGLDLLVPFDAASMADAYLLNLFCCKPDRAEQLAARGCLLDPAASPAIREAGYLDVDVYGWRHTVAKLPYGKQLAERWDQTIAKGKSADVERALAFYAASRDPALSPGERYASLGASLSILRPLCERQPSYLRLGSLGRVARDWGARALAVEALGQLCDAIVRQHRVDPAEPFLAPGESFDSIAPGEALGEWVLAAALEQYERLSTYSSFYAGATALRRLEMIHALGFERAEMERRLRLLEMRLGL